MKLEKILLKTINNHCKECCGDIVAEIERCPGLPLPASRYRDSSGMSIFAGRVTAGLSLQPGGIAPVHSGVKRENFRFKQKSLRHGPATYQRLFVATYFFKIPRENLCYR